MKPTLQKLAALLTTLCMLVSLFPAALAAVPTAITYVRDNDGVDSGAVYAIYTNEGSYSKDRILYHTGADKTDKVQGVVTGDELALNGKFDASTQLWTINAVEGGYTVRSVNSSRYLDLSAASNTNVNTAGDPVVLTITFDGETGLYTFSQNEGQSLSYNGDGNFYSNDTAYGFRLYKQTGILPDMAPGAVSGTSVGQPFVTGSEGTGSNYFRIPSLITLDNGWIVAASDIRWRTSGDSPQNLDTIVSVSKNGGATWDWKVVNYFDDMADNATGQGSASFIDPSILQAGDGTVHMVVDACPSYVGLMGGNKMGWNSSGFDEQGRLLVTQGAAGGDASTSVSAYTWYVDINNAEAGESKNVNGETITLYPICKAENDSRTGVWVDAWLNVYVEEDGVITPDLCLQLQSSNAVQSNLFYRNSQWKAYPVFYIMHRSATVTETGLEWSDPQFLDIKLSENEAFTGVCPGRGLSFQYDGHERLVFPLYDNATKNELASVIYSDDGGRTWTRGARTNDLNNTGKTSESQVVALPDGTLRMYSRNTIGSISYTDSTDGGQTWGTTQKDTALSYTSNCMVSFINLKGILVGPDNTVYENLILASYPKGSSGNRTDGVVRIGYADGENVVHWLNNDATRFSGGYSYSCLTQLPGLDSFGLLYEYAPDTNTIGYVTLDVNDLLGEGWFLLDSAGSLPSVSLNRSVVDLKAGETATLTATYTPANAEVTWTSSHPEVATVANGTVTAVTSGTTTITASVTSGGITRTASADVAVQGGNGVVVPDRYTDQVGESFHEAATTYELDTDGIDSGSTYAIFHSGSSRTLYHASGSAVTDHVTGTVSDGLLKLDSSYAATRQTWTVTGDAENGYTIQSCDDSKYLNLNTVTQTGSKVPVTDEAQTLTITAVEGTDGSYTISRAVDGQTLYLAHENATTQHYVGTEAVPFQFYRQMTTAEGYTYTTAVTGLKDLIADLSALNSGSYTSASWGKLQSALAAAQAVADGGSLSFDNLDSAKTAQAAIDQATADLYAAKLALVEYTGSGTGGGSTGGGSTGGSSTGGGSTGGGSATGSGTTTGGSTVIEDPDTPLSDLPYTDVDAGAWYAQAVAYAVDKDLMTGTSSTTFAPETTLTRAMMAQILYNLEGKPNVDDEILGYPYADVEGDAWYADAVYWARKAGLVSGYSDEKFGPEDPITREQLASILYRYAGYKKQDVSGKAELSAFADAGSASAWALDSLKWAVSEGILSGKDGNRLDPTGTASRAEVAQMLMNYLK